MPVDHSQNIIELNNICFAYNGEEVLHDVNLSIHKGDYLGIVGPNGGGKTTLLKIMLGLLPAQGSIKLFGQDIKDFKDWHKFGYVPQKATNFDVLFPASVIDVVLMGRFARRGLFRRVTRADYQQAREALEHVGMLDLAQRQIGDLSGGQQQRVFIARALAGNPEMIILDEPTTGVDQETQKDFYDLLKQLNQDKKLTLVLVSHDRDMVESQVTEIATVNRDVVYEKKY